METAKVYHGPERVLCSHCLTDNLPHLRFCRSCWSLLLNAIPVEEASVHLQSHWTAHWLVRLNRRAIRLGMAIAATIVVFLYGALQVVHLPVSGPSTQVGTVAGIGQWGVTGSDIGHTAWVSGGPVITGKPEWRVDTANPGALNIVHPSPVISNGIIYHPTFEGRLMARDATSGQLLWDQPVGGTPVGSPVITENSIYLALRDGWLRAVARSNGITEWEVDAHTNFSTSPMVHQGMLFIGGADGLLRAFDVDGGRELWVYDAGQWLVGTPVIYDNVVAVATVADGVHFIDRHTGRERLRYSESYYTVSTSPAFGDHRLIVTTQGGYGTVTAIDATKMDYPMEARFRKWRLQWYLWGLQSTPPTPKGFLWRAWLPNFREGLGSPVVTDSQVFVTSTAGRLHALDLTDGSPQWTYETGAQASGESSVASGDLVYVGTKDGTIHAIDRVNGTESYSFPVGAPVVGPLVIANGMMFTVTSDGTLHAFR